MSAEWAFDWLHDGRRGVRLPVEQVPDARSLTTSEG